MKRNKKLYNRILLMLSVQEGARGLSILEIYNQLEDVNLQSEDQVPPEIHYHIDLAWHREHVQVATRYEKGKKFDPIAQTTIFYLTWKGHDYIEAEGPKA